MVVSALESFNHLRFDVLTSDLVRRLFDGFHGIVDVDPAVRVDVIRRIAYLVHDLGQPAGVVKQIVHRVRFDLDLYGAKGPGEELATVGRNLSGRL